MKSLTDVNNEFSCNCINGDCIGDSTCRCFPGWSGVRCNLPVCTDLTCAPQGLCTGPNKCTCQKSYTGIDCSILVPPTCFQNLTGFCGIGCTNPYALNYDVNAVVDNGTCILIPCNNTNPCAVGICSNRTCVGMLII